MLEKEQRLEEVTKNFQAFQKLLPSIERRFAGKFAVLRKEEIIDYFDSMSDAVKYAEAKYEDSLYSIQKVSSRVVDLGYFSHAGAITHV